jgi:multifunctional methyltransferase subunit TRM112
MKPFLVGLLKCKRCPFTTELKLSAGKVEESSTDIEEVRIFNEKYYTQNNGERLRALVHSLKDFQVPTLSDEEVERFVKEPLDDARIKSFLFGCEVVDGCLTCCECGLVYPIRESILDTVDTN